MHVGGHRAVGGRRRVGALTDSIVLAALIAMFQAHAPASIPLREVAGKPAVVHDALLDQVAHNLLRAQLAPPRLAVRARGARLAGPWRRRGLLVYVYVYVYVYLYV